MSSAPTPFVRSDLEPPVSPPAATPLFTRAVFEGPGVPHRQLEVQKCPELANDEILVEIAMATICGSDLHTYEGRRSASIPCILGHEGVGKITAVGSPDDGGKIGQRVTWTLTDTCGCCSACQKWNLPQKCDSLFKYGHSHIDDDAGYNGCFASHIILKPGTKTVTFPNELTDNLVAPANCALATMVAVLEKLPPNAQRILIQGAGLLGIYGAALLRERGAEEIFVSDPFASRITQIENFGARGLTKAEDISGGFDAIIEVAGTPQVLAKGLHLLRPGGTYIIAGMVHDATELALRGVDLIRGSVTMIGVHNYAPRHLAEGIAFLARNADFFPLADLVSPPLPLSKIDDAFALSRSRKWARVSVVPDHLI